MTRRSWDGHWLRAKIESKYHFCGRCQASTRHARWIDAIKLVYAKCLMCREWNQWV